MNFIGKNIFKYVVVIAYLFVSFFIYMVLYQIIVIRNCDGIKGGLGAGYICGGYYAVYEKIALPIYLIFLLISIYMYIKNTRFKDNKKIFGGIIGFFLILLLYIIFLSLTTSTKFANGLPM